jgi:ubiquinone biosynthesis protein COQ9
MEESEDEEFLPLKEVNEKKPLSFGKKSASPASSLERPVTPIERVLASPQTKRKKLKPLRIISSEPENNEEKVEPLVKSRVRKGRKDKLIEESNSENDDVLESFPQNMDVKDTTPTGITRRRG